MSSDDRASWRTYAAAALSACGNWQPMEGWIAFATDKADRMLAEEERRFPEKTKAFFVEVE